MTERPRTLLLLALLMASWGVALSLLSLTRLYEFKTSIMDLACYVQTFWNFSERGAFLLSLPPPFYEHHVFGQHFTPFFFLIYPIYALFPYAQTFQFLQVWLIAASVWPIFLTARALGLTANTALIWAALFLFNPFTLNAAVWDFHEVCFATFIISWLMWALATRRKTWLLVFCVLLIGTKEHFGIAVAGAGLLWAATTNEKRFGIGLSLLGVAAAAAAITIAVPHFHPQHVHPMLLNNHDAGIDRFGWLSEPQRHLSLLGTLMKNALVYVGFFLASVLFLPVMAPLWLLPGLADLAANILSGNGMQRSVNAYHSVPLVPIFIVAAMQGMKKIKRFSTRELTGFATVATLALGWLFAPFGLPLSGNAWEINTLHTAYPAHDQQAIADIKSMIHPESAVGVQNNLGTVFAQHRALYAFPEVRNRFDMLVLRLEFPFQRTQSVFNVPIGPYEAETLHQAWQQLMDDGWGITYWNDPWVVIERAPIAALDERANVEAKWQQFIHQSKQENTHAPE